jgi:O-antigen/teichoic acid export membrane protein
VSSARPPLRGRAVGALVGQGTQALAGLVLQVAAARELGAAGLAVFSLAYGVLVLATAVSSGLVGDSLTVLDRHDPGIRAGLHVGAVLVAGGAGAGGVLLAVLSGAVPVWAGLLAGPAVVAFVVEDTLRRLLMAAGRFWSLPAVDLTGLGLALATLVPAASAGELGLGSFVVALLAGRTGAALVAWVLLPAGERPHGPWRRPALRAVAAFGVWRAAAQTIRPTLLTLLRVLVVAAAGAAAYGPLEAARVYTAPAMVLVAGLGSFLLPHFVSLRPRGARAGLAAADRAAAALGLGVALLGGLAVLALPWAGPLLTGGGYAVPVAAVVGWGVYAAAAAALLPYASLASVHGRQRRVLALRSVELGSLAAVALLVTAVDGGVVWSPLALALGPVVTALAVRRTLLVPAARAAGAAPRPDGSPAVEVVGR